MTHWYAAVEAGGTKFACAVVDRQGQIMAALNIPTRQPEETFDRVLAFFRPFLQARQLVSLGIASFGPLDLDPQSAGYGSLTATPKSGWTNAAILTSLADRFQLPAAIDTDVNAAAMGEQYWIAANKKLDPFIYITVGTGIGAGIIVNGHPVHGLQHPEAGHMFVPHDRQRDPFQGVCPFHQDCLEGLASGPAMEKRWQASPETLPSDHPAWELEADYLAYACANLLFSVSPQKMVLGGGVMQAGWLLPLIRQKTSRLLNAYIHSVQAAAALETLITEPGLGTRSGILGAVCLAVQAETSGVLSARMDT